MEYTGTHTGWYSLSYPTVPSSLTVGVRRSMRPAERVPVHPHPPERRDRHRVQMSDHARAASLGHHPEQREVRQVGGPYRLEVVSHAELGLDADELLDLDVQLRVVGPDIGQRESWVRGEQVGQEERQQVGPAGQCGCGQAHDVSCRPVHGDHQEGEQLFGVGDAEQHRCLLEEPGLLAFQCGRDRVAHRYDECGGAVQHLVGCVEGQLERQRLGGDEGRHLSTPAAWSRRDGASRTIRADVGSLSSPTCLAPG